MGNITISAYTFFLKHLLIKRSFLNHSKTLWLSMVFLLANLRCFEPSDNQQEKPSAKYGKATGTQGGVPGLADLDTGIITVEGVGCLWWREKTAYHAIKIGGCSRSS
jgi:hypothetical protein